MGGKKSKAPKAPDYTAAANAQAAGDLKQAQYQTALDRPSQSDPYGSVGWTFRGADINNPKPGDWHQSTTLTPQQQAILNAQQKNDLALQGLGSTAIGQAQGTLGQAWNPNLTDFQDPAAAELGQSGTGIAENRLDQFGNLQEGSEQFMDRNKEVQDALYQQLTQFSDERFGRATDSERNRLAAMGLQEGTKAYQNAMQQLQRQENEHYGNAQLQAVLAGGQEQSRMFADQLAARQSNIGLAQGQFGQDQARYGMDLAEREAQASNQFNQANQAAAQRQQQFQEQAYGRSLPINEISSLLGGSGVTMPQFSGFAPAAQSNAADILGATQAQYNAQMGGYNAGQSQKGGLLGAATQLGGSYLGSK